MQLSSSKTIDFYVSIIDNYGDMGFALNLAQSLYTEDPKTRIRFFCDDENLFRKFFQTDTPQWIEYMSLDILTATEANIVPSNLIYSFFDYKIPKEYLAKFPFPKTIVVFSYFLLHKGLESLHGTTYVLENGYDTVIHFVPSLLAGGGGVIVNPIIEEQKYEPSEQTKIEAREQYSRKIHLPSIPADVYEKKWISVFVYSESMERILERIGHADPDIVFFIFGAEPPLAPKCSENIVWMPFLSLVDYGVFQSLSDVNIVRGENSLCQALVSGKPTLWDIYKESNGAHQEKIADYLVFLGEYFTKDEMDDYGNIMRDFNAPESQESAFLDFMQSYADYEEGFQKIAEYVKGECDLVEKLERIQKK